MKRIIKRVLLVLLCALMLQPVAVPGVVSAVESTTYNIGYYLDYSNSLWDQITGNQKLNVQISSSTDNGYIASTRTKYNSSGSNSSNFMLEGFKLSVDSVARFDETQVQMYTYQGDYFVFRIKSPGAGVRSLTLKHGTFFRDGVGTVYVLPVTTQDIDAALKPENRVGKVDFYNINTTAKTGVQWGQQTVVGSWNFGNDAEYFVVLQCSEASPIYPAMGYMHVQSLTITEGELTPTTPTRGAHSMVVSNNAITTFETATYTATGMIDGQPHIYIPTEGKKLFVYNLETGEKYDEVDTRFTVCRGITADDSGKIWMVGDKYYLQCYDPLTKILSEYTGFKNDTNAANSGHDLIYAPNGCLYFGSSSKAHIFEFNIATQKFRDLGNHNADASYSCGLAYDPAGFIYAGLTGNVNTDATHTREIVKIRLADGVCVGRTDVSDCVDEKEIMVRGAALCGDIYIAGGIEMNKMLAIDTDTMDQTTLYYDGKAMTNPINFSVSESLNGKHYFTLNAKAYNGTPGSHDHGLYSIDDATGQINFVSGKFASGLQFGQDSIIRVNGENCIFWHGGGEFRYMPLLGGDIVTLDKLVSNADGASVTMDSIALGAPGSGEVYLGAFNNYKCSAYNINTGEIAYSFYANGQTDCMITYNGQLYAGNYKRGILVQIDREDLNNNKVLLDFCTTKDSDGNPFSQVRVHALAAGDGKIFAGTMPDSYLRGGCIGWYDTVTGETYIERNVVQNQSINSLAYHDGYLYGTTTVEGGTGSKDDTTLSAKLFIYDVANKRKVKEIDLRNEISGLPDRLKFVSSIVADPNVATNGKFWGVVSETLFSFTFNKSTETYTVKEELSIGKTGFAGPGSKPLDICFLDGYIYIYFSSSKLFCKINYSQPSQYSHLPICEPKHYVIAEDKNLYYINDSTLYMYPLDITQADKTAANAVDSAILAFPEPITAAAKTQIEAARAEYAALPWDQKALVQYRYLLEEAECQLLDARLAALDLNKLNQAQVNELQSIYNNMTQEQRSYVNNAAILKEAQDKLLQSVYAVGDSVYSTLAAALAEAPAGALIRLLKDNEEDDVELTNGVTLDLNGYTLFCDSLDCVAIGNGHIIDSKAGSGLLSVSDLLLLREDNTQMPLMDNHANGYRFFAYSYMVDTTLENVKVGTVKAWYRLTFDSAAAYELVAAGRTGLELGTDLYWNDDHLVKVIFGRGEPLSADTFCAEWAEAMQNSSTTWLYVQISGMDGFGVDGTLTITPFACANGVRAQVGDGQSDSIIYEINAFDYGWTERT